MKKRIASAIIALLLCLTLLPATVLAAEPDTRHTIQLGASAINGWSQSYGYDYIYLGNWKNNPVKWRVLSANGDTAKSYQGGAGNTSTKSNALFMLSEDVLAQTQFGGSGNKKWEGSTAESWCDGFKTSALTAEEQFAVFTTVRKSGANGAKYNNIVFDNKYSSLLRSTGNKVFFLSVIEANDSAYGFSNNDARKATGGAWWLLSRTTKRYGSFGTVSSDGVFQSTAANSSAGARPALNLDKRQVLFTSAADNSAHKDFSSAPENYTGHEFKLTLKDSNTFADGTKIIGGRTIWNNQYSDATITIQHKALEAISRDYTNVTATLTDSEGTLLYYGSVNTDASATTTTVTLPERLADDTYTLALYGEDWNGEKESDSATGTPFTVKITIHDDADGPDLTPRTQDGLLTIDKISGYDAKWGYNYIYFGKFDTDPILWRVLSTSGNATGAMDTLSKGETTVSNDNAMFLLSEYLLGQGSGIVFNANGTAYQGSAAQTWCGELLTDFTENEQNVVLATVKNDAASTNDENLQFPAVENILNGDKVFFPSIEEMKSAEYGFSSENDLIAYYGGSTAKDWWMRSAGTGDSIADAEYDTNKTEYKIYTKLANEHSYARPAFNLSKNDVLFATTANGVKSGNASETLTAIAPNTTSKWKLTLRDDSRTFNVTETEAEKFAGGTLTLHYTGEVTGANEFISAILYDTNGKAAYYGQLKNLTDNDNDVEGVVELTVPAGLDEDEYKLVLFNEQYNGANQTDYASAFCEVTLTVDNTAPELSGFAVSRASDSTASVTFTASERGSYYYVVDENETAPSESDIYAADNDAELVRGEQTLKLDNVSVDKSYLHIMAKDVAGNLSTVQTIAILGFLPAPTNADWDDAVLGKASWDAVEHASGYSIQLYKDGTALGSAVTVAETNCTFTIPEPPEEDADGTAPSPTPPANAITEAGTYSFRVTALGDNADYSNSVSTESARHLSSITVEENENGTVTASARYAVSGTEITLTGDPNSGYRFYEWNITPEVTVTDNKFTMPEEAVTVIAVFARRSTSSPSYPVTIPGKTENGTVTVSPRSAEKGDSVTITVKPDSGYQLDELTVTDKNGKELKLTDKGNGKYMFTMPAGKVEVNATFVKEVETSPFSDVSTTAYYYEAVKWAQEKGITGGIGNSLFGPNRPCTRAQIVTFLWRAAGSPVVNYAMNMTDVAEDAYYAEAVRWALSEGITTGTGDGKFSPDTTCTRAQSVTFLFRAIGKLVDSKAEFNDVLTDSYYANAVAWAVENGVTNGIGDGLFGPNNSCTRAQSVTFLYRAYQGK